MKLTNEDFIKKSKEIHGNKYDYSRVDYIQSSEKVILVCPIHGEFLQKPNHHLNGKGCRRCAGNNYKSTTDEFINKSKKIHGDKYIYNNVIYKTNITVVEIICLLHGSFIQTPHSHLSGKGCPTCGGSLNYNTKEFIEKARKVHGNTYGYNDTEYVNGKSSVIIKCYKHGNFFQKANNHLNGHGCFNCGVENKHWNNGFKWKSYIFPNNKKVEVQGYEVQTLDYLLSSSINPDDIKVERNEKPTISYVWNGVVHKYFPDCYIPIINTIIETKSAWTWNKDIDQNRAKITGSLDEGYNIRFIVWNGDHTLSSDITYIKD